MKRDGLCDFCLKPASVQVRWDGIDANDACWPCAAKDRRLARTYGTRWEYRRLPGLTPAATEA